MRISGLVELAGMAVAGLVAMGFLYLASTAVWHGLTQVWMALGF